MAVQCADSAVSMNEVVDIGVNLTHRAFRKHWRNVVQRAIDAGVTKLVLTGTYIQGSEECLGLCQTWFEETGAKNLYATVGVHPHDAKTWNDEQSYAQMKTMLSHPLAVAVKLAVELNMPLFLHEREAHNELVKVLDEAEAGSLPPIVVHCFTGTKVEAMEYIQRGYYIGFTGTICKKERGAPLREMLTSIPLERVMVETDAPFMGFKKGRKSSEPADCIEVARKLAETVDMTFSTVCEKTTTNAVDLFQIND
eukprot:scaffold3771_cov110-Skeletonema_dohrnii-CCMP3373.AAC.1